MWPFALSFTRSQLLTLADCAVTESERKRAWSYDPKYVVSDSDQKYLLGSTGQTRESLVDLRHFISGNY